MGAWENETHPPEIHSQAIPAGDACIYLCFSGAGASCIYYRNKLNVPVSVDPATISSVPPLLARIRLSPHPQPPPPYPLERSWAHRIVDESV